MKTQSSAVPVIDLFAGPGGLSEGFAAAGFDIRLSIEKDPEAHRTLELRAFFRQFERPPDDYYEHLRQKLTREELFARHPFQAVAAMQEALLAELGKTDPETIRSRIRTALAGANPWVLIGGPPCQAYSLVGRSRNRGVEGYSFENDHRATLYVEYLRIIADHWPAAFVMENVPGILSAKRNGELVFSRIAEDLRDPASALGVKGSHTYTLHALGTDSSFFATVPADFVIRCERHGIPQARHRVIIVGLRNDVPATPAKLRRTAAPSVYDAIGELPEIRSGLSKEPDSPNSWAAAVLEICQGSKFLLFESDIQQQLKRVLKLNTRLRRFRRGNEFLRHNNPIRWRRDWFHDRRLAGVINHRSRGHIRSDLHRYLFAVAFAKARGSSPKLADFPRELLPQHENATDKDPAFADRFRVQLHGKPCTTVTSHISKDGHYCIPDKTVKNSG